MKVVASTDEYTIYLRRDGRHAVKSNDGVAINGDAKVRILLEHELIVAAIPKEPDSEPEVADVSEAVAEESAEGEEAVEAEEPVEAEVEEAVEADAEEAVETDAETEEPVEADEGEAEEAVEADDDGEAKDS